MLEKANRNPHPHSMFVRDISASELGVILFDEGVVLRSRVRSGFGGHCSRMLMERRHIYMCISMLVRRRAEGKPGRMMPMEHEMNIYLLLLLNNGDHAFCLPQKRQIVKTPPSQIHLQVFPRTFQTWPTNAPCLKICIAETTTPYA